MEKEIRKSLCRKCLKTVRNIEAKKQRQRRLKVKVSSLLKSKTKK